MKTRTMDIPVNAEVKCCGRDCGRSTRIVLNPVTREITHLVVKQRSFPYTERLVPVDLVVDSTPRVIHLRCDAPDLTNMGEFIEADYVESGELHMTSEPFMMWPYIYITEDDVAQTYEQVPVDKLAIRRGARVIALDGQVGRVAEFVVDRSSEHITHLVLQEGHLWEQQNITIPVSCIKHIADDAVYLNVVKAGIAYLPGVAVHHS